MASNTEIREWAKASGYSVSDRGSIPRAVQEAYKEAHRRPRNGTRKSSTAPKAKAAMAESSGGSMPVLMEQEGRASVLIIHETRNGQTSTEIVKPEAVFVDEFTVDWDSLKDFDGTMEMLTQVRLLPEGNARKRIVKELAGRLAEVS